MLHHFYRFKFISLSPLKISTQKTTLSGPTDEYHTFVPYDFLLKTDSVKKCYKTEESVSETQTIIDSTDWHRLCQAVLFLESALSQTVSHNLWSYSLSEAALQQHPIFWYFTIVKIISALRLMSSVWERKRDWLLINYIVIFGRHWTRQLIYDDDDNLIHQIINISWYHTTYTTS